ncbi:hypothetical protein D3C75_741740 [compost metagenome]
MALLALAAAVSKPSPIAATACLASPLPPFTLLMASAAMAMERVMPSPVSWPCLAIACIRSITASISALFFAWLNAAARYSSQADELEPLCCTRVSRAPRVSLKLSPIRPLARSKSSPRVWAALPRVAGSSAAVFLATALISSK